MIDIIVIILIYVLLLIIFKHIYMKVNEKSVLNIVENKEFLNINKKLKGTNGICEDILKKLDAKDVKILTNKDEKSSNSFYNILNNSIVLCNNEKVNNTPFRLLFISHECHHSIQDKKMLWTNFILANINMIYSFITIILILFNVIGKQYYGLFLSILLIINIFSFLARIIIEADATYMSVNISRNYAKEFLNNEELEKLTSKFEELISGGFSSFAYGLLLNNVPTILIYMIVILIKSI